MKNKLLNLCLIRDSEKILLGMKKRGFGIGRWNGFGGKINDNESMEEAAKREIMEESNIKAKELELMGIIEFEFQGDPQILEVHIFYFSKIKNLEVNFFLKMIKRIK